jgi:Base plate wedge protein 53
MYFDTFQNMYYSYLQPDGTLGYVLLKDITQNVRFKKEVLENISLYEYYDLRDGDTPEIVAEKFYGSPMYHWVIMIANQKYDYVEDFPKAIPELEQIIRDKYGEENVYGIHHYVKNGFIVSNIDYPDASSVSNYDYEFSENEKKRRIKIISPNLLQEILRQFRAVA